MRRQHGLHACRATVKVRPDAFLLYLRGAPPWPPLRRDPAPPVVSKIKTNAIREVIQLFSNSIMDHVERVEFTLELEAAYLHLTPDACSRQHTANPNAQPMP